MMSPAVLHALLEGLDEALLRRLLAPYAAFLSRKGAEPDNDAGAWLVALSSVLRPDDPDMPVALQHALWAIAALASPEGEGELRAIAAERNVGLSAPAGRAAAVAAEAYLDHRALLRDARARLCSRRMGLVVAYEAAPDVAPRPLSPAGRAALRRGGDRATDAPDATTVSIADLPHEIVAVYERPGPAGIEGHPETAVVTVFDKARRVLLINAPDPEEQDRLRALFGRVFYGREAAFRPARCLTGAPFRELGEASMRPSGVEGLAAVHVRKLVVHTARVGHLAFSVEGDDLAGALGEGGPLRELLRLGEVVHCALEFFLVGRSPFRVELYPPNRWRLDDRRDTPLVRSFLALRGFLVGGV
jgi:hypothetical protein